jgi:hypothetical protein
MTIPHTLHLKTPDDLLAVVPFLFGFHPSDSLVVLTGGEARDPVNVRVDLPDSRTEADELADYLVSVLVRHAVRTALLVVYSGDPRRATETTHALVRRLGLSGVHVGQAIRADGARWWPLPGGTGLCGPAEGTPYDLTSHELTAQAVLEGRVTLASRQQLAEEVRASDPAAVAVVHRAAEQVRARLPSVARSDLVIEGHWVEDRVRRYLEDGEQLEHGEVGRLLLGISSVEVRDVAWASMRRETAEGHRELWRDVLRRSPPHLVAPPAALLGFAAWLCGDGALAWCAVERCQEADPGYSLAALLAEALAGAVSPSTWRPVERATLTLFSG